MGASGSGAARQMRDKDRTHEPLSMSAPQRGRLAVVDARETSMHHPFGRQYFLRRSSKEMAPVGPRAGRVPMIRLSDVPGMGSNALRILGPDYLVPKDPDAPAAQRTILHGYSWGEKGSWVKKSQSGGEAKKKR